MKKFLTFLCTALLSVCAFITPVCAEETYKIGDEIYGMNVPTFGNTESGAKGYLEEVYKITSGSECVKSTVKEIGDSFHIAYVAVANGTVVINSQYDKDFGTKTYIIGNSGSSSSGGGGSSEPVYIPALECSSYVTDYCYGEGIKQYADFGDVVYAPENTFTSYTGGTFLGWSYIPAGEVIWKPGDMIFVYEALALYPIFG